MEWEILANAEFWESVFWGLRKSSSPCPNLSNFVHSSLLTLSSRRFFRMYGTNSSHFYYICLKVGFRSNWKIFLSSNQQSSVYTFYSCPMLLSTRLETSISHSLSPHFPLHWVLCFLIFSHGSLQFPAVLKLKRFTTCSIWWMVWWWCSLIKFCTVRELSHWHD